MIIPNIWENKTCSKPPTRCIFFFGGPVLWICPKIDYTQKSIHIHHHFRHSNFCGLASANSTWLGKLAHFIDALPIDMVIFTSSCGVVFCTGCQAIQLLIDSRRFCVLTSHHPSWEGKSSAQQEWNGWVTVSYRAPIQALFGKTGARLRKWWCQRQ